MLKQGIRFLILRLIELFYPRIEVDGRENLPSGPAIFVLNHPNGLLDPLVLMAGIGRHAHFLAKSTFFANPLGRLAMGSFGALPVYRQRDEGPGGRRCGRSGPAATSRHLPAVARCCGMARPWRCFPRAPLTRTRRCCRCAPAPRGSP